jgi:hypothetical protein
MVYILNIKEVSYNVYDMRKDIKINTDTMSVKLTTNPVDLRVERNYFIIKKRESCADFLENDNPNEFEMLNALLNLHFVLEIGINAFFRNYYKHCSNYDFLGINTKVIDSIDFRSKIILFINCNKFNLSDANEVEIAHEYAKKIPKIIDDFNGIRNMIVHGHSISEASGTINDESPLKLIIKPDGFKEQSEKFKKIVSHLIFFIDRLETTIPREQINMFRNNYLDMSFPH